MGSSRVALDFVDERRAEMLHDEWREQVGQAKADRYIEEAWERRLEHIPSPSVVLVGVDLDEIVLRLGGEEHRMPLQLAEQLGELLLRKVDEARRA